MMPVMIFIPENIFADIIVIARKDSPLTELNPQQCRQLWLGDAFSIGTQSVEVSDHFTKSEIRHTFYQKIINISQKELRSIRARKIYVDGQFPPDAFKNDGAVMAWITSSPNRIGYISDKSLSNNFKVLFRLPEED